MIQIFGLQAKQLASQVKHPKTSEDHRVCIDIGDYFDSINGILGKHVYLTPGLPTAKWFLIMDKQIHM